MTFLVNHPERNVIRLQLKQNAALATLTEDDLRELESQVLISMAPRANSCSSKACGRCRSTSSSTAS